MGAGVQGFLRAELIMSLRATGKMGLASDAGDLLNSLMS